MINCHTHLFTSDHVPTDLLKLYAPLPNIILRPMNYILNSWLGDKLLGWTVKYGWEDLKRYGNFLRLGYQATIEEQFGVLKNAYPEYTRFVVLTQDFSFVSEYKPHEGYTYLDYKRQIYELKLKYPGIILPFHFIEPRLISYSQDPIALLESMKLDFINGWSVGLKMYPAEGYYPFDYRINAVYAFAQEHQIAIMTHASVGGSRYVKQTSEHDRHPIDLDGNVCSIQIPDLSRMKPNYTERAKYYSDPDNYKKVLNKYPKLKICMAHAGSDAEIRKEIKNRESNMNDDNWYRKVLDLVDSNENVYVDISYSLHSLEFIEKLILVDFNLKSNDPKVKRRCTRLLFGTDFYLTYQEYLPKSKDNSAIERNLWEPVSQKIGKELFALISEKNAIEYLKSSFYN
jgi:predicted TIM-barrel fold metal-dependent hydrolase